MKNAAVIGRHGARIAVAALLAVGVWPLGDGGVPAEEAPVAERGSEPVIGAARALTAPASGAASAAAKPAVPRTRGEALATLDTRLIRDRISEGAGSRDAFATKSWMVTPPPPPPPPPAPPPPPPPPPQAPPLPFKYMGMMVESPDRTVWYLLAGERLIVAATGDVVDSVYRIDGADSGQIQFTYLPLEQRQQLAIGVLP